MRILIRSMNFLVKPKTYIMTALAVASFSQLVVHIFGQTIPSVVTSFFKEAGFAVILGAVFIFAFAWFLKAKPSNRPKDYTIVIFDIYGNQVQLDGLRTDFKNHDVAWSFMKQYKESYPMNNFAMVSKTNKSEKPTIFRYI